MAALRVTDTNSANDSKGRALGLDGDDFLFVVAGLLLGLGAFAASHLLAGVSLSSAALLALALFLLPCAWVWLFRHDKPAGYAEDWFDQLSQREGWSSSPFSSRRHD